MIQYIDTCILLNSIQLQNSIGYLYYKAKVSISRASAVLQQLQTLCSRQQIECTFVIEASAYKIFLFKVHVVVMMYLNRFCLIVPL